MEPSTQTALVLAAQAGEQKAFEALVGAYQRELLVHCYRMLGSFQDAEDLVQETLLRAWEKCATLTSPGAYRGWLYRIATNLCLDRLRSAPRRSLRQERHPVNDLSLPLPNPVREPIWLEPFPDDLLADLWSDPEDHAERSERITLAFLVALQHLTPAQRAILLLREVLGWKAAEVAEWLNLSVAAVNSALQRARRVLRERYVLSEQPPTLFRPSHYNPCWSVTSPAGSKGTSQDSWRCCERTPGSPCHRLPPGSRDALPLPRCSRPRSFFPASNDACSLHEPMAVRLSDSTSAKGRQTSISSLVSLSWKWWANRLEVSLRSWIWRAFRSLPFHLPYLPPCSRASPMMTSLAYHLSSDESELNRPHAPSGAEQQSCLGPASVSRELRRRRPAPS
jgi:RNA polymerase sigma factor (sigma-70 family)